MEFFLFMSWYCIHRNRQKSIRENCPHLPCGIWQSLIFSWGQIFKGYHSAVTTSFILISPKHHSLPDLSREVIAVSSNALFYSFLYNTVSNDASLTFFDSVISSSKNSSTRSSIIPLSIPFI